MIHSHRVVPDRPHGLLGIDREGDKRDDHSLVPDHQNPVGSVLKLLTDLSGFCLLLARRQHFVKVAPKRVNHVIVNWLPGDLRNLTHSVHFVWS